MNAKYYNLAKLARDTGISYRTVTAVFKGKHPRVDIAMQLSEQLGMSVEEFIDGIAEGRLKPLMNVRQRGENE